MKSYDSPEQLRSKRPLLLALEAIGWLHMIEKARAGFLLKHGGSIASLSIGGDSDGEKPSDEQGLWSKLPGLIALKQRYSSLDIGWPEKAEDFLTKYTKTNNGVLGLLQAGHAMSSGIEKNLPKETIVKYLGQDTSHMWLSTAFGQPVRNLLADPPELLSQSGWSQLLDRIKYLFGIFEELGAEEYSDCVECWWRWREGAVGSDGWLRSAFTSSLAETRLPNNDVTLFHQSFVAAALFKSAAAGALLEGDSFPWKAKSGYLKFQTRWRLLTIGVSARYYEARAVKIGDWTGARLLVDRFFERVRKFIEVELALGSLLYADGETLVFSFPGERYGWGQPNYKGRGLQAAEWKGWLAEEVGKIAKFCDVEIPPYCRISEPSRSLINMITEIKKARETTAIPLHGQWQSQDQVSVEGHVCPVCFVQRNGSTTDKEKPCELCRSRRTHRLKDWLCKRSTIAPKGLTVDSRSIREGLELDSIWISELADANDRVALVTMSLGIEPWLDGTQLDSLRTQAFSEWLKFNPELHKFFNSVDPSALSSNSLTNYIESKLGSFNSKDHVLRSLHSGYERAESWEDFYHKIVEDRSVSPAWKDLSAHLRAKWLAHQLLRKLASPGRIYRFQSQTETFFNGLLVKFREVAASSENRWRVRRLAVEPEGSTAEWMDNQVLNGRFGDAPLSLLHIKDEGRFLTICNLARFLKPEHKKEELSQKTLEVKADDSMETRQLKVRSVKEAGSLGAYNPVILLELSPVRFRVLLPLDSVSTCVDRAIEAWKDQFARVWDRLPLRIGVVAFPRMTPFQAVIESARTLEDDLDRLHSEEEWRVSKSDTQEGITTLNLKTEQNCNSEHTVHIPVGLPDGRKDVFYPYLALAQDKDEGNRFSLDFQHPDGRTYRHAQDLQSGDRVHVSPSYIATLFMESTSMRFDPPKRRYLAEWLRMRDLWRLLLKVSPSQTALQGAWADLSERREKWQDSDGKWVDGGKSEWLDLARAVFHNRLRVRGSCLDAIVQAAGNGLFDWSLQWHVRALKQRVTRR